MYSYGEERPSKLPSDKPVKAFDHACNALRYALSSLGPISTESVPWPVTGGHGYRERYEPDRVSGPRYRRRSDAVERPRPPQLLY